MAQPPEQQHDWGHRGITPPRSNGTKWQPWITWFLSFICGILSATFFLGGKSRDVGDLLVWKLKAEADFGDVWKEFKRMDRDGTNRSHLVDEQQSIQISANLSKIVELERRSEARGEQINVMQGKIERLERELEINKGRGP
jgi:hypothetical protein